MSFFIIFFDLLCMMMDKSYDSGYELSMLAWIGLMLSLFFVAFQFFFNKGLSRNLTL